MIIILNVKLILILKFLLTKLNSFIKLTNLKNGLFRTKFNVCYVLYNINTQIYH